MQAQLDLTTKQLRELRVQQQQLQTRNVLLEKIAQLSKEQTSEEYLVWQVCFRLVCLVSQRTQTCVNSLGVGTEQASCPGFQLCTHSAKF